ncbi:EF-hand domain-containing protein, partial [Streptomyces olivaceus]
GRPGGGAAAAAPRRASGPPPAPARQIAAGLDADGDGRVGEAEVVPAFARYFTVPE